MSVAAPESGHGFVGYENLHHDIYPAISAKENPALHQPDKVVLITGAGRGIGRAIALQYAHAGVASIILCARTASQLDEVESSIHSINPNIRVHKQCVDVASSTDVAALASEVGAKETHLDVLVNNAGHTAPYTMIGDSNPEEWWRTIEVNLKGPYLLTHAFLPMLLQTAEKTGNVHIVNMSSMGAHLVTPTASMYEVSKLALCRLTEHLNVEYAEKGINVVGIHPGGVRTALAEQEIELLRQCKWYYSSQPHGVEADMCS
jgi:NAD(P)-dependent dehydrogenase (short-subunit alcohol dehydrogenase family)